MDTDKIIEICHGEVINKNYSKFHKIENIITDSRSVQKGDLFVALIGEKFDGHDFIEEAINNGAHAILVEKNIILDTNIPVIKVKSTREALIHLATYHRSQYDIPLIAITGSTGKTTTKDLIAQILATKYRVLKSEGNHNNHIGVPKTLFKLNNKYDVIVTELGMNHLGEISLLSKVCKPTVAVITNIGTSHIGNLGSQKKIFKAKMEITDGMEKGLLVVNGDNKYLKKLKSNEYISVIKCGQQKYNDLIIYDIKSTLTKTTFKIKVYDKEYKVTFNIPGVHLINNVVLAIKVGLIFKIPIEVIIDVIKSFKTEKQRMNIVKLRKNSILIDDAYNSSYESLLGALELIKNNPLNKIIILGDILELGKYSKHIHWKVGQYLKKISNKTILLVGNETKIIRNKGIHFNNNQELIKYLKELNLSNSVILVKGSRAMHLEEVTEYLKSI